MGFPFSTRARLQVHGEERRGFEPVINFASRQQTRLVCSLRVWRARLRVDHGVSNSHWCVDLWVRHAASSRTLGTKRKFEMDGRRESPTKWPSTSVQRFP